MTVTHGPQSHAGCAACNSSPVIPPTVDAPQLPLWHGPRNPWARCSRIDWQTLAHILPANLSVELTAEHGWRIVPLTVDARHALELLDITEGDVTPDAVARERRRRHVDAHQLLEQALAVLRTVQADNDTRVARRRQLSERKAS